MQMQTGTSKYLYTNIACKRQCCVAYNELYLYRLMYYPRSHMSLLQQSTSRRQQQWLYYKSKFTFGKKKHECRIVRRRKTGRVSFTVAVAKLMEEEKDIFSPPEMAWKCGSSDQYSKSKNEPAKTPLAAASGLIGPVMLWYYHLCKKPGYLCWSISDWYGLASRMTDLQTNI